MSQSTYLATICQEQLLRQGDTTSCRDQIATLELRQTYDFLTRLHDEFEPLCAQLLARRPMSP
jgi:hypothetical protein